MAPLSVYRGAELQQVLKLLQDHQGKVCIIAGGTDIILKLREKKLEPEVLLDISDINELKGISEYSKQLADTGLDGLKRITEQTMIKIGAGVTFSEIAKSPFFSQNLKGLADAALSVGSPQIRNAATIGGNICNASPAADIIPVLLALEAEAIVRSREKEETMSLQGFILDKGSVKLLPNQLLCSIAFSSLKENQSLGFAKLGLRKALAISRIAVAAFVEVGDNAFKNVRLASGACGKIPKREYEVEACLEGKAINDGSIEAAAELFKQVLKERLRGRSGAEYKGEAVKGVFKEALRKALGYQNI